MRRTAKTPIFPLIVIMGAFLIFSSSCEDVEDNEPNNITNGKTTAVFNPAVTYGTMTDQDGNVYKTVTIDSQTWMAENLRTTKYNDGTAIPNVTDGGKWATLTTGAYCNHNNTADNVTIATYGRLYNWYAANTGKLAPKGWHVPTDAEWTQLSDYLGGAFDAGGKLKETGTTHWLSPNEGATNETGFTALPVSGRNFDGSFSPLGYGGNLWSISEDYDNYAWLWLVYNDSFGLGKYSGQKEYGFSVRCVRD